MATNRDAVSRQMWKNGSSAPRLVTRGIWALAAVVSGSETNGDFVTLAFVVKTQGRHGEVAAEVHSDVPDRFVAGMKLFALGKNESSRRALEVEDLWPHKGLMVLKFAGVDSISDAEALIGSELQIARAERAALEIGWTYVSDLVDCRVFDHGKEIGRIEDVQFGAGEAPLLIVGNDAKQKFDVPFAEAYLDRVDVLKREVHMNLPEGMMDINTPMTAEEKRTQAGVERARLKPRRKVRAK